MSNVVFIVLVILFFSMMLAFIVRQSSQVYALEEQTAKKLALIIDSSEKGTQIVVNVGDVLKKNQGIENPISIEGNLVSVKLSAKTGYQYSFFNKINAGITIDKGGFVKIVLT